MAGKHENEVRHSPGFRSVCGNDAVDSQLVGDVL